MYIHLCIQIGLYVCDAVESSTKFALSTFPSKYNGPVMCVYYFLSPKERVKITFLYLDIVDANCNEDRIELYDGFIVGPPTRTICNGNRVVEFISTKSVVTLVYTGNSVGKYRGFHGLVTFL